MLFIGAGGWAVGSESGAKIQNQRNGNWPVLFFWEKKIDHLFLPLTVTRVVVANRGWPESVHLGAIGRRGLAANSAPGKGRAYVARGVPEAPRCTPYIGGERTKAMD